MERGYSSPADGMANRRGIVVALVGFEPTTPPYKRVALTAGLQSHVAALPGGGKLAIGNDNAEICTTQLTDRLTLAVCVGVNVEYLDDILGFMDSSLQDLIGFGAAHLFALQIVEIGLGVGCNEPSGLTQLAAAVALADDILAVA